jgi:hypothetical protein
LNHTPSASRLDLNAFVCAARVIAQFGRFLLMAIVALLITTPLTQHFWRWDCFLHGGQDFELGAFAILIVLCLVLVLAHQSKQNVGLLFAARSLFFFICHDRVLVGTARSEAISAFRSKRGFTPDLGMYSLPIQI